MVACGLWLIGLAAALLFRPAAARGFLGKFASSARAHFTEQLLRLAAGAALVVYAAEMRFPEAFRLFGWVLVTSAAALMLAPWRWHRRFAEWVVPLATRRRWPLALGSFALGAFVLYAALSGAGPR